MLKKLFIGFEILLSFLLIPFQILFAIGLVPIQILLRKSQINFQLQNQEMVSDLFQKTISVIESYRENFDSYPEALFHPEIIRTMGDDSPNLML